MDTLNLKWISCKDCELFIPDFEVGEKSPNIFLDEYIHDTDNCCGEDGYDPKEYGIDVDNFKGGTAVFARNNYYFLEVKVDEEYRVTKINLSKEDDGNEYDVEEDFYFEEVV